jgi:lysophospholipid acyltransferase 1/2
MIHANFYLQSRRMFRHHFQETELTRTLYDGLTYIVTRFFLAYTTAPFVLLELEVKIRFEARKRKMNC